MQNQQTVLERFRAKYEQGDIDTCWIWQGSIRLKSHHGGFSRDGQWVHAHRMAWELANGAIPPGAYVLHRCHQATCVNPAHLYLGTHRDNMRDAKHDRQARQAIYHNAKLSAEQVREIRQSTERNRILAARFGVSTSAISNARRGTSYSTVPDARPTHRRPGRSRLTDNDIRAIRASPAMGTVLAKQYGVSTTTICAIRKRKQYADVP